MKRMETDAVRVKTTNTVVNVSNNVAMGGHDSLEVR